MDEKDDTRLLARLLSRRFLQGLGLGAAVAVLLPHRDGHSHQHLYSHRHGREHAQSDADVDQRPSAAIWLPSHPGLHADRYLPTRVT